jgi:hypothetical protein
MLFLAQLAPKSFWNAPAGSPELYTKIAVTLIFGFVMMGALTMTPTQLRRPIIATVTFLSGLFYVLFWAFPSPIDRQPAERPQNAGESFSFWLADAQPVVAQLTNIIAAFLIGLGIYSLLRIHVKRIQRKHRDWFFSLSLILSMVLMVIFGYLDYGDRQGANGANLAIGVGWGPVQYGKDLLFDGLLQQMDAAMFSIVAFYILSAAYRAFRARSTEATILLLTALIVMLSLLGAVVLVWDDAVTALAGGNPVVENLKLSEISQWIRNNLQTPSIRGIDFGVGIGLLAMGLRIWLSLEKTGGDA